MISSIRWTLQRDTANVNASTSLKTKLTSSRELVEKQFAEQTLEQKLAQVHEQLAEAKSAAYDKMPNA